MGDAHPLDFCPVIFAQWPHSSGKRYKYDATYLRRSNEKWNLSDISSYFAHETELSVEAPYLSCVLDMLS